MRLATGPASGPRNQSCELRSRPALGTLGEQYRSRKTSRQGERPRHACGLCRPSKKRPRQLIPVNTSACFRGRSKKPDQHTLPCARTPPSGRGTTDFGASAAKFPSRHTLASTRHPHTISAVVHAAQHPLQHERNELSLTVFRRAAGFGGVSSNGRTWEVCFSIAGPPALRRFSTNRSPVRSVVARAPQRRRAKCGTTPGMRSTMFLTGPTGGRSKRAQANFVTSDSAPQTNLSTQQKDRKEMFGRAAGGQIDCRRGRRAVSSHRPRGEGAKNWGHWFLVGQENHTPQSLASFASQAGRGHNGHQRRRLRAAIPPGMTW